MERVSLNGVKVYPFTSHEELLAFVSRHKGILVAINAEKILHATDQTRSIINRNIGYCDGFGAVMALKEKGHKEVIKIPLFIRPRTYGNNVSSGQIMSRVKIVVVYN